MTPIQPTIDSINQKKSMIKPSLISKNHFCIYKKKSRIIVAHKNHSIICNKFYVYISLKMYDSINHYFFFYIKLVKFALVYIVNTQMYNFLKKKKKLRVMCFFFIFSGVFIYSIFILIFYIFKL